MIFAGFDPGFERLGIAFVEKNTLGEKLLFSECFTTAKTLPFPERLRALGKRTDELLKKFKPDAAALEELFLEKNQKTAMRVSEVRGVLTYVCSLHDIPTEHYSPLEIKQAVLGYGRGDKRQVIYMVQKLLKINKKALDDEYDAIATALTLSARSRALHYPQK